jgi:hypothetical protein
VVGNADYLVYMNQKTLLFKKSMKKVVFGLNIMVEITDEKILSLWN